MKDPMDRVRRIALVSAVALGIFIISYTVLSLFGGTVEFSDSGLEKAVRAAIHHETGALQQQRLERITHLDAANFEITHLRDIALLANLRTLDLSGTRPASLAPLTDLTRLEELRLRDTGLRTAGDMDLGVLAEQPALRRLDLEGNRDLDDIEGLARFTNLRELSLRNTGVNDLEPLASLVGLRVLDLRETNLDDQNLAPLRGLATLEHLNLRESGITDIGALTGLSGLRYLNLHSNPGITSLEPLRELPRLQTLILRNVPVGDQLSVISRMRSLQRINLRNTGIRDLDVLADLMRRGALQDHPDGGISAEVDIRDNPIRGSAEAGPYGYDVLLPYWNSISRRYPEQLPRAPTGEVLINEIMTSNGTVLTDYRGKHPDWIELLNPGQEPIHLGGAILAPGTETRESWRLPPDTRLAPGEHLVVFASGRAALEGDEVPPPQELHASFTLSSGGTDVVLKSADRRTLIDKVTVPPIPRDTSYGRTNADPDTWKTWADPTPGARNRDGRPYHPVTFSHPAGFHDSPFNLALISAPGVEIYYTLDGSVPDPDAPDGTRTYRYRDHRTGEFMERTTQTHRYRAPIPVVEWARLLERDALTNGDAPATEDAPATGDAPATEDLLATGDAPSMEEAHAAGDAPATKDGPPTPPSTLAHLSTTVPEAEFWDWQPPAHPGFRATVVRAVAYDGEIRGNVYSATYFVTPGVTEEFPLGVIAINADPESLYGYDHGIYVPGRMYDEHREEEDLWMRRPANYRERTEVPAHIEFFEPDGFPAISVDGGVRIHGGWSRSHPLKSLRLYARKDYDRINYFEYPLFPGATMTQSDQGHDEQAVTAYKRLMLRSGQSLFRSHLQDAVAHAHVRPHVEVDLMEYRPVIHFINGEYWGIKNLRERFDRFYLEVNYGVDPYEVIILDGPLAYDIQLDTGRPGENRPYREMLHYVESNDMAREDHYAYIRTLMDVDSFIDYNIVRIFSGDSDGVTKHVAMWRLRREYNPDAPSGLDGRWRWHTWDFDNAFMFLENDTMTFYGNDRTDEEHVHAFLQEMPGVEEQEVIDAALLGDTAALRSVAAVSTHDPRYTMLLTELFENAEFRARFINRFADLMNTVYAPEIHARAIREAAAVIEPEMERHIRRWGYPATFAYWRSQVERNIQFARERPDVQRRHILDYFGSRGWDLSGTARIAVEVPDRGEGGTIRINTVTLDETMPGVVPGSRWEGVYFQGVPVTLEALPEPGYRFAHWETSGSPETPDATILREEQHRRSSITIELAGDLTLRPRFVRATRD